MAGCCDLSGEVPDGLVCVGKLLSEEAAAVAGGEDAGVAPALSGEWAGILLRDGTDVQDVDHQQVAGLGALDGERTAEFVDGQQRGVKDVAAESLLTIAPSNHSRQSTRKEPPV